MTVNFNPSHGVTAPTPFSNFATPPSIPVNASPVAASPAKDTVTQEKTEKKGPVRSLKDFIRAVKKFGINISEYTKGTFKGIAEGLLVGAGIFTAGSIYKGIKQLVKKPSKMPVKALAVAGGLLTLAANYWKTSLNANEKKADVDHRYTTTPVVDGK